MFKLFAIAALQGLITAQNSASSNSKLPPICSCYCCPGSRNPYGVDLACNITSPPWVGDILIGNAAGCGASQCYTSFSVTCPPPPIQGPKNTSGTIKWGCESGCRFGLDGTTIQNRSSQDVGQIIGLDQQFGGGYRITFSLPLLLLLILADLIVA